MRTPARPNPMAAGIWLGLGLGGFFDGIVFHQVLQWHHMLSSAGYPPNTVANLQVNTLWDGVFHGATYGFVVIGLVLLWRLARRPPGEKSGRVLAGAILLGFGLFNLIEGSINHHLLGLHHVNETAAPSQWLYWDLGFLAWGAVMAVAGAAMVRAGRRQRTPHTP